ncbi:DinB family protein [Kineosporia succinea]|uniref:Damage-inducible protein DinB n=1 Tax=Kineosporia succinea TaxID=84632 RepID=A0ABT9NYE2_9ACTN|nr:DinB family protein [Kineosporia succinea]MDP9825430.1 putative damage-inducible protein DinB [Kineosporia succinea]
MSSWISPAPPVLPEDGVGPLVGPDRPMLEGYLDFCRATLLNICAGLTPEQLAARPLPTSMSLLGLIRHLTKVERVWLRIRAGGEDVQNPFTVVDEDFDRADASGAQLWWETYVQECALATKAAEDVSFEHTVEVRGQVLSLRMIYVHLIGEYQRHNGHADLIRESLDGVTGR